MAGNECKSILYGPTDGFYPGDVMHMTQFASQCVEDVHQKPIEVHAVVSVI